MGAPQSDPYVVNQHIVYSSGSGIQQNRLSLFRHPLKFTVEGDDDIKLFPEEDERINILNVKRGIISALAVPVLEEDRNKDMVRIFKLQYIYIYIYHRKAKYHNVSFRYHAAALVR